MSTFSRQSNLANKSKALPLRWILNFSLRFYWALSKSQESQEVRKLNFEVCVLLANIQFCGHSDKMASLVVVKENSSSCHEVLFAPIKKIGQMEDFRKFSFSFSCWKKYLPFMPIMPIMFLAANILKKMIAENKRLCVGSSSIRNYSKKWHEIQFHCARFERRTGKGDFDILHQIWLQICFSMKHNIKTTFVNVFTGK